MLVLNTCAGLSKNSGGPSRSIVALSDSLVHSGAKVVILCALGSKGTSDFILPKLSILCTRYSWIGIVSSNLFFFVNLVSYLFEAKLSGEKVVVIDHGAWLPNNLLSSVVAWLFRVPYVIHPRGMLMDKALAVKPFKKKIAWWMYQRFVVKSSDLIIVSSNDEGLSSKLFPFNNKVITVPNSVAVDIFEENVNFKEKLPQKYFLFLGRKDPIKNLDSLLLAWGKLGFNESKPNFLIIAGPNSLNYQFYLSDLVERHGIKNVVFLDQVDSDIKFTLLKNALALTLVSHTENFGMVVPEALSVGTPVITSKYSPWSSLVSCGCGLECDTDVNSIMNSLRSFCEMSEDQLVLMRQKALSYYIDHFVSRDSSKVIFEHLDSLQHK